MRHLRYVIVLTGALILPSSATIHAQATSRSFPLVGFWVAQESLPKAMNPICGQTDGRRTGTVAGGLVVMPVWRIGLEARISRHFQHAGNIGCAAVGDLLDGTRTIESADVPARDFTTFDLRLRTAVGRQSRWVLALGAGWAMSMKDLPYFTSSVGLRGGTTVRWGADLALYSYRVPWTVLTAEYDRGSIVNVISDTSMSRWATSLGLGITIEVPLTRGR